MSGGSAGLEDYNTFWPSGVKPNSKSIVILIESFNIMGTVRVGLRQTKLGQNVEIFYLNVNKTDKIRQDQTLHTLQS